MSGICGWLHLNNPEFSEIKVIDQMVTPLKTIDKQDVRITSPQASVAAVPLNNDAYTLQDGNLFITYIGRAHWSSAELQAIADKDGMCKAISVAYKADGNNFLQKLLGPFATAIVNTNNSSTLMAIDRIGIQPLCYNFNANSVVFSSTVTSISRHPFVSAAIDPQGIYNYFYFHMVPSPGSIYQNVEKLLPGQYVYFEKGNIKKDFYWQLEYQDHNTQNEDELSRQCMHTLREAIVGHASKEKTGAFLSGGTDSSTMAGLLTEYLGEGAETFSIGFDAEGFDETEYANIAVNHFGTKHHEYRVTADDVADTIPLIANTYDEPFGNASAVPTYFCAKMAKENGIDIMIAGDGGDEIFAGNERYAKQQVFEHYYKIPEFLRKSLLEPIALKLPGMGSITPTRKLQSYIQQARVPLPDRLESYNFLNRTGLTEIFTTDFLQTINPQVPLTISQEAYNNTHSQSIINKMMHLDLKNTLADNDLRKVNKMCEAAGIDVRYPLLDEEVVKFAATVPPALQLKDGKLRYFFKYAMKDFLPKETLTKSKHGFGLPFGLWLKENPRLQEMAHHNLAALVKRGIINQNYINFLHEKHQTEHASYYGVMVWVMLILEAWLQQNNA